MINKLFRNNKTLRIIFTATMISALVSGCGNSAADTAVTDESQTAPVENVNKDLSDFFGNLSEDDKDKDSDDKDEDSDDKDEDLEDKDEDSENRDEDSDDEDLDDDLDDDYFDEDSDEFENDDTNTYSHTIMIYMVGSDLESQHGAGTAELAEILQAQPDVDEHNVVVFTGGASKWQLPSLDADKNYVLELKEDDFYEKDSIEATNMGDADSLSNFINYCYDEYDTDKYSLILWNHGAGPVMGFGLDENYKDILGLPEIQTALDDSVGKAGEKLEFIGFDACLMSSLEVTDALAPYANYMISSQETEPGYGWNYSFLSKLSDPGMNGAGLGKEIIDSYMEYSEEIFEQHPSYYADLTLSCVDLNKYDAVEKAMDSYFNELGGNLNEDTLPKVIRERAALRSFGSFSSDYNYSLVDSVDLVKNLADSDTKEAAKEVVDALNDMIVYEQTNMDNANGISICFPYGSEKDYTEAYLKVNEYIDFAPTYTKYLDSVYALQNGETIAQDWNITDAETEVTETEVTEANITSDGSEITLQLTEDQRKNFAAANFYILASANGLGYTDSNDNLLPEDLYFLAYVGKNVQMDKDGKLHALYDNNLLYVKCYDEDGNSGLSPVPMLLYDNDITNTKEKRYTSNVILSNITDEIDEWYIDNVQLQIIRDEEHPDGYVRSAIPLSDKEEEIHTPDKQLIDIADYNLMEVVPGFARYLTKDDEGNTLPYFSWEKSDMVLGFDTYIDGEIEFESMSIPDPENYVCMFVISDSQGNITSSDIIPLK